MDLSRVKTLLIIAFLGLNLFLGYKLWFGRLSPGQGSVLSSSQVEEARQLLSEKGFELQAAIPRQIPQLSLLTVSRRQKEPADWLQLFFAGEEYTAENAEGGRLYLADGASLLIRKNGQVIYKKEPDDGDAEAATVESYLQEQGLWNDGLKLDLLFSVSEDVDCYRYVGTFQGFPLFSCATEVFLQDKQVVEVRINPLVPLGFSENKVTAISALAAVKIFVAAGHNFSERKIADISLGYYSPSYDASSWEAAPVWRIAAADGRAFYINAFSGDIESYE